MKPTRTIIDPMVLNAEDVAAGRAEPSGIAGGIRIDFPGYSMLFFSGIAATDAQFQVVGAGDLRRQTEHVLDRIQQELETQGGTMNDIVKTRTYVVDLDTEKFKTLSQVKARYFGNGNFTTGTLLGVSNLAIPGLMIEIEVDAILIH
jgi:enamine deaminase RidA (YjgF/YER057c/UK114 family)